MYSFFYLIVVSVGVILYLNEIIADLDVERDTKLSTVNITFYLIKFKFFLIKIALNFEWFGC